MAAVAGPRLSEGLGRTSRTRHDCCDTGEASFKLLKVIGLAAQLMLDAFLLKDLCLHLCCVLEEVH